MNQISGRHALVTGGSSGIGLATAHALAKKGARVTIVARRLDVLASAEAELRENGADAAAVSVDVSDKDAVKSTFRQIEVDRGPIEILVCSAGVAHPGYFEQLDDSVFRDMIEIDYFGTLWPIRAVLDGMIQRNEGSIVGIASNAALVGVFGYSAYGAAKFAVRGLLESLRAEMTHHNVHVACCFPPDVDTPQLAWEDEYKPDETRALSGSSQPLPPEKIADCIVVGIEKRRFVLLPDVGSRLLSVAAGTTPGFLRSLMDRSARKTRRRRMVRPDQQL
ncbi:MAG: SDR family oxidoreductase [Actinomycetes bacterium]